jgi:hypothetical protein
MRSVSAASATDLLRYRLSALRQRPQLEACFDHLRTGDVLVVWRLDRLGRGLQTPHRRGRGSRRAGGRLSFVDRGDRHQDAGAAAAAAPVRRAGRVRARAHPRAHAGGLAAARRRGRLGGRRPILTPEKLAAARAMRAQKHPMHEIAAAVGVSGLLRFGRRVAPWIGGVSPGRFRP